MKPPGRSSTPSRSPSAARKTSADTGSQRRVPSLCRPSRQRPAAASPPREPEGEVDDCPSAASSSMRSPTILGSGSSASMVSILLVMTWVIHSVASARKRRIGGTVPAATAACRSRRYSWATGSAHRADRLVESQLPCAEHPTYAGAAADAVIGGRPGSESARGLVNREIRERLLLCRLEVGVGTGGVVGDVDDTVDFGHRLGDGHFDALAEGDCGHAAALAPSS